MSSYVPDEADAFEAAERPLSARAVAARPAPYLDDLNPDQRAAYLPLPSTKCTESSPHGPDSIILCSRA